MKRKIEIKKIPLEVFINTLMEIYNSGVDYIDMMVEKGGNQDSIWVTNWNNETIVPSEKSEVSKSVNLEDLA